MNVPRWAAIGVIVFVAIIAAAVVLIAYTADAFDRATPLPFVYLADPDRNSPGRVHWVAGQSRTFTATVADVPAPALVVVSDDLRLVPDGEESAAALCIEPAAAAEVEDGQELTVYACIVTSEATIRLRNAADAQVYGTFRFQVHDAADPIPSPTPPGHLQPPGRVGGVVAERVSDDAVVIRWDAPGDLGEFFAYGIRRRPSGGGWDWMRLNRELTGSRFDTSMLDNDGIEPGVVYEYQVRAVEHLTVGEWSEPAAAALQSPDPPANVVVAEDAATEALDLAITWSAAAAGETPTRYGVERSVEHGPWTTIHLLPATSAVKYVESASPSTFYCYRVRATNEHGSSAHSPRGGACVNVPPPTPTPVPEPTPEGG